MKLYVSNVQTIVSVGGTDNLADPDFFGKLRNYFGVPVPGAWHTIQYKKHVWDGYKYFITPKGRMLTGFLPLLIKHVRAEYPEVDIEVIDERLKVPKFNDMWQEWFTQNLPQLEFYEHQILLINKLNNYVEDLFFPRGIIDASTNSGKTLMIAVLHVVFGLNTNMLVIIHRKEIFKQLVTMIGELFPEITIGKINADEYDIQPITIAMVQSLTNKLEDSQVQKDLETFGVLAVDESFHCSADNYKKCISSIDAPVRVLFSGTALDHDNDVDKLTVIGLAGPIIGEITKRQLMDKGISRDVKIRLHLCNTKATRPVFEYDDVYDELVKYSIERAYTIKNIIDTELKGKQILIAVDEIKHGTFILNALQGNIMWKAVVEFVHGEDELRDEKIQRFKDKEIDVLISTSILQEGVNIPGASRLIYCVAGHSKNKIKQWMGRVERIDGVETEAIMYDFYDIGKFITKDSK